ncbi:MAG TPA: hypothetical protein VGM06_00095 [Polyangiaceae bacterium]
MGQLLAFAQPSDTPPLQAWPAGTHVCTTPLLPRAAQHSLVAALQVVVPHGTVPVVPGGAPDEELLLEPTLPEEELKAPDEEPPTDPDDDELTPLEDEMKPPEDELKAPDEEPPTDPDDEPGWTEPVDEPLEPPLLLPFARSLISINERAPQPHTETSAKLRAARTQVRTAIPWW